MSTLNRQATPMPELANKLRALNDPRVRADLPRKGQVPQSIVSPAPPKGQNNTGMKLKSR